jgi:hypothetical protein
MDRTVLPLTRDLRLAYLASFVVAAVIAIVSVAGLLFGTTGLYGSETRLFPAFLGQDLLNLLVGLPILLGSMWLARRGSLTGLLCWPGALFYVIYDYAFYAIGAPFSVFFEAYLVLIAISTYAMIGIIASVDTNAVRAVVAGMVPARVTGGFLVAVAVIFVALWTTIVVSALLSGGAVDAVARAVVTLDLTIQLPALLVGGVLLWRRSAVGYAVATGLLLQAAAYLLGLSALCLLGTDATGAPVTVASWAPGLVVGAIAIVLIGFFVRGAAAERVAPAPRVRMTRVGREV